MHISFTGVVNTNLSRYSEDRWFGCCLPVFKRLIKTPLMGAQTTLYCLMEPSIAQDSGKYYEDCRETRPHRRALDEESQKRLWELSEEMVGIKGSREAWSAKSEKNEDG